jgi:hypothetical protein
MAKASRSVLVALVYVVALGCRGVSAAPTPLDRPTTFASRETGTIHLASYGGDVPSPWGRVTKLYLTLSRREDLRVFSRLWQQHRRIAYALLREIGAYSYAMRDADVTGWYVEPAPRNTAHVTLSVETWIPQDPPTPH